MPWDVLIVGCVLILLLAHIESEIITAMYLSKPAILSFPARIFDGGGRRVFLFAAHISALWDLSGRAPIEGTFLFVFTICLFVVMVTDWEQQVIFDKWLLPFGLLALSAPFFTPPDHADRFLAGAVGFGLFLFFALITRGGIGGGDVKLVGLLGLWLGTEKLYSALVAGAILGGVCALILIIFKRQKRDAYFAYGPYLAMGGILAAFS